MVSTVVREDSGPAVQPILIAIVFLIKYGYIRSTYSTLTFLDHPIYFGPLIGIVRTDILSENLGLGSQHIA